MDPEGRALSLEHLMPLSSIFDNSLLASSFCLHHQYLLRAGGKFSRLI